MAENDFDRTESATPRRREEARQEGNVARSQDLTSACLLLGAVLLLHWLGFKLLAGMKLTVLTMMQADPAANPTRADDLLGLSMHSLRIALETVGPFLLLLAAIALLASAGQVGVRLTPEAIMPKFSKLNPLTGLKHLLDARAGVRLVMSLAKVGIISAVALWFIYADLPRIATLSLLDPLPALGSACQMVYLLAIKLAILLLVLAISDYAFQYWQRERDLRMTKQEVKEEMRRMEGDPLIKQRRGRIARQLALQRISSAVPRADVVVTNPTHFAIALRYDAQTMKAPKVVAKGADFLAMRIRQLAALHGVPLVERKELAQALYKSAQVGQEISPQFYNAVAQVLAYVYRLSGRRSA